MSTLDYFAPDSRAELLSLLAERGPDAKLLAGGTDLLVDLRNRQCQPGVSREPEEGRRLLRDLLEPGQTA